MWQTFILKLQRKNRYDAVFLFEVTEDIKEPAKNILMLSDSFYKLNEKDQKDAIKIIRNSANGVLFKINNGTVKLK